MSKRKPVIGVTEPSQFTNDCIFAIETFFKANPVKLCQNESDDLLHWVKQCDAVILAGGKDIHPRVYGYAVLNNYNFNHFDVNRDYRELRIIQICTELKIPILGICRGHQMLGIYHGLSFYPDLSESVVCHQPTAQKISHNKNEPMHWVELTSKADERYEVQDITAGILPHKSASDSRKLWVNSFHHQGLNADAKESRVDILGISPGPPSNSKNYANIVELMRDNGHENGLRFISAQWHPEYDFETNIASRMVLSHFKEMVDESFNRRAPKVLTKHR